MTGFARGWGIHGTAVAAIVMAAACSSGNGTAPLRASGYVEATEVRVAPEVGGRVLTIDVAEGDRVVPGAPVARLATTDTELAIRRAQAERDQAVAQLQLLQAGARPEELRQASAQVDTARADVRAAQSELESAEADLRRFEALLEVNAGSRKQRDDAATRRDVAQARVKAAQERMRAAAEGLARLEAGARREELAAGRARVAVVEAQIAALEKTLRDAEVLSPLAGVVTSKLVDAGEIVAARTPLVVVTDLDHAWANVYIDEPVVPTLKLGDAVTLVTDAGQRLPGTITYISPRAEFTPRNVQTAEERSRLVYRIKVTADNREGILKPGMPVEAEIPRRNGAAQSTG
ncbi:MAG TPA: HlyD family efflux transporter periplasmic adaptor subunit [Vicinamibacterales bacterium]|nr:HlyD family efflux transporter periplasmic adaptor subunit [Vicinamibacterales bacterium]